MKREWCWSCTPSCKAAAEAAAENIPDTQVVVIGNGPAGLSVSAFLSGIHPYYDSLRGHPDDEVHRRMARMEESSLIDQDLSWYEQQMPDTADRSMGYLYDSLARPSVDSGLHRPSSLRWSFDPTRAVPHIVLGATAPGGSWSTHDPEMVAVSVGGLLDLPAYPMAAWMGDVRTARMRQSASVVAAYMADYPRRVGIADRIRAGTTVTRLSKTATDLWRVEGVNERGRRFSLTSRRVVLATGMMQQRRLEVDGEVDHANVVYTQKELKQRLAAVASPTDVDPTKPTSSSSSSSPSFPSSSSSPVVVVGDGISAADAILLCMERGVRVIHVMRKNEQELRRSATRLRVRFSKTLYPEYYNVFELMQGRGRHTLYERRVAARVAAIDGDTLVLKTRNGEQRENFSVLAACIGQQSTFDGVLSSSSPSGSAHSFGSDYRSEDDASLFCVGSAVGDHYVRFLVGGCLHVAQQIVSEHEGGRNAVEPIDDDVETAVVDTFLPATDEGLLEISC